MRDIYLSHITVKWLDSNMCVLMDGQLYRKMDLLHMVKFSDDLDLENVNLEPLRNYWCSLQAALWANCLVKNVLIRKYLYYLVLV